jgi:hypothetical protein
MDSIIPAETPNSAASWIVKRIASSYRTWLMLIAFISGVFGAQCLWKAADAPPPGKFVLEMTVPALADPPWGVDLYVNNLTDEPGRVVVHPGARYRYEFPCTASTVNFLRLDPVQVTGVEVAIHSLTIEVDGAIIHRFTPSDLAQWTTGQVGRLDANAFYLKGDKVVNHIEKSGLNVSVPVVSGKLSPRRLPRTWLERLVLVMALLFFVDLLFGSWRSYRLRWMLLALTVVAVVIVVGAVADIEGIPDVSTAVGFSSYRGAGKLGDLFTLLSLLLIPAAMALLVRTAMTHWSRVGAEIRRVSSAVTGARLHAVVLFAIGLVVVLYYLRGASYTATVSVRQELPAGWDTGNGLLWSYLFQTGAQPYRDFWYPYGEMIWGYAPFPWGVIYNSGCCAAVLVLSLLSFYVVTRRSLARATAMFAIFFALAQQNVFPTIRYAILVPFLLSYIGIGFEKKRVGLAHVIFWLAAALSLLGDLVTVFYGWLLVGLVIGVDAWEDRRSFRFEAWPRAKREFLVPFGFAVLYILKLTFAGQLPGFLHFYLQLGGISAYAATPAPVEMWMKWLPAENGFFLWGGAVLFGLGLFLYLTEGYENRREAIAIAALGLCTLMLFYKQLVHQNSAYFFGIPVPIAGCLVLVLGGGRRFGWVQRGVILVVAGMLFGTVQMNDGLTTFWQRFERPTDLWADFKSLVHPPMTAREYVATQWDLKNFRQYVAQLAVLDAIQPRMSRTKPRDLFTLTDDQAIYIMARKEPPFYPNQYDGSPIAAQQLTVKWLDENRPSVVLFNTRRLDLFMVPAIVRAPLVYEKVILGYVPDTTVGDYAVLRLRTPAEPVDLTFWSQYLGAIDLLELPRNSSIKRFQDCAGKSGCVDFLQVRTATAVAAPTPISLPVTAGGQTFTIKFMLVPAQQDYTVYLDRLWFWGGVKRAGLQPTLGAVPAGIQVSLARRASRDDILY